MKPLQAIGMGLVIIALVAKVNGYDLLADPLGWLLVLHGTRLLPRAVPWRETIQVLAAVAGIASVALWFPGVDSWLSDTDDSLVWAAAVPQIVFVAVLCAALTRRSSEATDARAASWLRTAWTLTVAVGVLPILVYPAAPDLLVPLLLLALLTIALVIVLLFNYSGRPWAQRDDELLVTESS